MFSKRAIALKLFWIINSKKELNLKFANQDFMIILSKWLVPALYFRQNHHKTLIFVLNLLWNNFNAIALCSVMCAVRASALKTNAGAAM